MHIRAELKTCQLRDPFPRSMQKVYPFWASVYPLWDISGHSFTYADLYKLIWTYKTDTGVCGPWLNIIITNTAQYNRPNTHTHISTHHVCVQGASHVVLVGDHFQLPPVVKSKQAQNAGLGLSLFERLMEHGVPAALLQVHMICWL